MPAAHPPAPSGLSEDVLAYPYALPGAEVLAGCGSGEAGLSNELAARRRAEVGPNALPQPKPESPVRRFLRHLNDVLIYIRLASAALKAIIGDWVDFGVILAVALLNGTIGFIQEGRAEKAPRGSRSCCPPRPRYDGMASGCRSRPRTSSPAT